MKSKSSALRSLTCVVVLLAAALPVISGCSGGTAVKKTTGKVEGTVTFSGKPVTAGSVTFEAKAGGAGASAELDASGKFTVADPIPVGTYVAIVMPVMLTPDEVADGKKAPPSDNVPEKYRSVQTSDLTFEVKEGPNTFQVQMKP